MAMEKKKLVLQVLICVTSLLLMSSMIGALEEQQEVAEGVGAAAALTTEQKQALHEDIVEKIESTTKLLHKAQASMNPNPNPNPSPSPNPTINANDVNGSATSCPPPRLFEVSVVLSSVESLLLQDHVPEATQQVDVAISALSSCLNSLVEPAEPQPDSQQAQNTGEDTASFMIDQAISLLQAATISLNKLDSFTNMNNNDAYNDATLDPEFVSPDNSMLEPEAKRSGGGGCRRDGTSCQFSSCGRGKGLTFCAMGFAYGVTGGAKGPTYIVTRSDDNPTKPQPGSLRYAVGLGGGPRGIWIVFSRSMIIVLRSMLWVRSSTTIDGRGANITINGRMLVVGGVSNVILHNFQINSMDESDTIHVFAGSTKVWVDHITSFDAKLGLISVVQKATDVTISNCKLSNRNFNMLLGASDSDLADKNLRVTVYRNWFRDSMQRMPHCRWGFCHVINNLYTDWGYYAIGGRVHARILSESNVFIAGRHREVTPWFPGAAYTANFDSSALIYSYNDLLLNGATFHQFRQPTSAATNMAPPYRSAASYPPLLPNLRALPDYLRSCSGAVFSAPLLRQCLRSAGLA